MSDERILDVRAVAPARRHTEIFEAYEALVPGAGFVLVNDHDPVPLYHQFAAERAGRFTWDVLEAGPTTWRVRIGQPAGRLRPAPAQRFAGAEHVYDLGEVARRLRAEPRPATDGHRQMTIAHHGSVALVIFDFEAGGRLVDHVADGLVTIHALSGRIRVRTADGEHVLPAGSLLVLAPGVAHDLHADEPSEMLLTVHLEARPDPA